MAAKRPKAHRRFFKVALLMVGGFGVVLSLALLSGRPAVSEGPTPQNAAPTPTPVAPDRRLIFTYYFYWYDSQTGGHLQEQFGLRYHFPPNPAPSWRSVAWHEKQLMDMRDAGIDVVLPVYWGFDRPDDNWSWEGLPILADAWSELASQGKSPPVIGMFYDTTIIGQRDLTTRDGQRYFYANIKDFFTRIPRQEWALVNGQPVVFLFTSDFTSAMNQSTFDYVAQHATADFGVAPYVVREVSWDYPILRWQNGLRIRDYTQPILTASSYLWDAAYHGFVNRGGVAAVGPGYDDSRVPGRAGRVRDRANGQFYRQAFDAAIASGKRLLAIETWDEMHEGSGINETAEYGRQYIDLTHALAAEFHDGGP